jgi:hypothetical protein
MAAKGIAKGCVPKGVLLVAVRSLTRIQGLVGKIDWGSGKHGRDYLITLWRKCIFAAVKAAWRAVFSGWAGIRRWGDAGLGWGRAFLGGIRAVTPQEPSPRQ